MHRHTLYFFFIALIFTEAAFLLGHLYFKENMPKELFWSAPACTLSSFLSSGMPPMPAGESSPEPVEIQFPSNVSGLVANSLITGEEALEYARKIHGKDASIQQVFVSHYSGSHEQALLWLFEFSSADEARKHMEKVSCGIEKSRTLRESGLFYLQNVEICYAHGPKQNNYFYNKQNKIYWISLFNEDPLPLFLQFYQYF